MHLQNQNLKSCIFKNRFSVENRVFKHLIYKLSAKYYLTSQHCKNMPTFYKGDFNAKPLKIEYFFNFTTLSKTLAHNILP